MIDNDVKKEFRYAKNVTVSSKHIILYRGTSVVIYDRQFIYQKKITNLKYVYKGYVSPDEKILLLVSSTNRVYIVSLENFTLLNTYTVAKPYNYNLEGLACWYTENSFLLPVQNSITHLSAVRKICYKPNIVFEDFLSDKFWIVYVTFVECNNQYLFIGLDRNNNCWNLIWMNKQNKFIIHKVLGFNEAIFDIQIICNTENIVLTGESKMHCCDFDGNPSMLSQVVPVNFLKKFGFPCFFKLSQKNTDFAYVGTLDALIVWSLSKRSAIKICSIEFGARNIEELDDLLLVSTFSGIKLLSITDFSPI